MQVSLQKAINIVKKNIPNGKIDASIRYRDLYLFKVFIDNGFEKEMDPFYSVNINTGEFRDFSILTDGDIGEITNLFNSKSHKY
jgi:hypothetical protein